MTEKKIIIDIPFNIDLGAMYVKEQSIKRMYDSKFSDSQTKEWIDYRIDIFMRYTGISLMNQTNQDFLCLMRYNAPTKAYIFDALSRYPKLPSNIIFTCEADRIIDDIMKNTHYLYHVRIDSDNMYKFNFIEEISQFSYDLGLECLLCQDGYIYDTNTDRLGVIHHTSPSLYVYLYNEQTYQSYFKSRLFENHFRAAKLKHKVLQGRNYMVIVHKKNVDNEFDIILRSFSGRLIEDVTLKDSILKEWKIKR